MLMVLIVSCLAIANAQNVRNYGCIAPDFSTLTTDVLVDSKPQGNPKHVDHYVKIKVSQLTKDWSVSVCFDTPQCVTAAWNVHSYREGGDGIYCTRFVSTRSYMVQPEGHISFRFQTYGPAIGGIPSTVRLDGNGVYVAESIESAPADATDFCAACDGGYAADFSECGSYHHCFNGVAYKMPCPSGLHWDTSLQTCNYPAQAGCSATSTMGQRRMQCSGALNNCPPLDEGIAIYGQTYHISACDHDDVPPTTPTPGA